MLLAKEYQGYDFSLFDQSLYNVAVFVDDVGCV